MYSPDADANADADVEANADADADAEIESNAYKDFGVLFWFHLGHNCSIIFTFVEILGDPGISWGCHGPVFGRFRKKTAAVN